MKTQLVAWILRIVKHNYFLLFFLWFILTTINIDKAFHIDDTFHLEASDYIKNNLLKPMSGSINWTDYPTPLYTHNQPPLFFYLIALISALFGMSEISMHLFLSVFTFFALYYFYKTAQRLSIQNAKMLLVLFAFCPALIINQNVMTDIPVLALIMGSTYFLLKANYEKKRINYSLSALLLGLGLLIKYSLLPILIVLFLVILIRREYKNLIVLIIPLSMLCLWSYWNYLEYGSIHIFDRPKGSIHPYQFWTFMACLGSMSTFSISLVLGLFPFKIIKQIIYFISTFIIISIILFSYDFISEQQYAKYLNYLFIINGLIVCITLVIKSLSDIKRLELRKFISSDSCIILIFLGSMSAFLILFAPFIATRHILLIIPFILLFGHELINKASSGINRLTITVTIILGLLLGVSDWIYADYYRQMASVIDLPKDRNIWTVGHWGWQWYSKKNGMLQYNTNQSDVKDGDYFVYPGNISNQNLGENINYLIPIGKKWKAATVLTFFSGNNYASLYYSDNKAPWSLSKKPIDTIFICKIGVNNDTTYYNK